MVGACFLRHVVAEAGPEHIVDAFSADAVGADGGNRQARPALAQGVSVLHAQAHAAIVALVEVVPVADGGFLDVFGLGAAASPGVEAGGTPVVAGIGSGEAGGVVEIVRTVADWRDGWRSPVTAPYLGVGILRSRGCAERSPGPGATTGVVPAVVQIDEEAGSGGKLYRAQTGGVVQGREFTAGRGSNVGQRAVAIAANTRSVEALEAQSQLVVEHHNATARAYAAQ